MNTEELIRFCLTATEKDFWMYSMISQALFLHETSNWVCHKCSEKVVEKYRNIIGELKDKYLAYNNPVYLNHKRTS